MENNHLAPIDSLNRMRCENPSQHVVLIKNIAVFVLKLKVTEQLENTLLANEISRDSSMRWVSHENYYECNSSKFVSEGRRCVQCWLCLLASIWTWLQHTSMINACRCPRVSGHNGHKPKRPKPKRPQRERPQTGTATNRNGLWPFRFVAFRFVAVSVCGHYDLLPVPAPIATGHPRPSTAIIMTRHTELGMLFRITLSPGGTKKRFIDKGPVLLT